MMEWQHIYPANDLIEHSTDKDGTDDFICECNPDVEIVDNGGIIIHSAMDRREVFEDLTTPKETT